MSDSIAPVPVGVVGVGRMGSLHARTYARLAEAKLVGVFDIDADRASHVAAELGCRVFADEQSLAQAVRAASVAVPTSQHLAVALQLIGAGVDVLVEKPLAATVMEARQLVVAAELAGRMLMVGHSERFNPVIRAIAPLAARPGFLEVHRLAPFSERGTDVDVVVDLMIHDLDLVLQFVPSEIESVDAVGIQVLTSSVDIANARLRFRSGTVANLTASRVAFERLRKVRLFEPDRYVSLDTGKQTAKAYRLIRDGERPRVEAIDLAPPPDEEPIVAELRAFLHACATGAPAPVPGREGLRALELADQVRDGIAANGERRRG